MIKIEFSEKEEKCFIMKGLIIRIPEYPSMEILWLKS